MKMNIEQPAGMPKHLRPTPPWRRGFDMMALALVGIGVVGLFTAAVPVHLEKWENRYGAESVVMPSRVAVQKPVKAPLPVAKPKLDTSQASVDALRGHFQKVGYTLASVRAGTTEVPRLFVESVPYDLKQMQDVKLRKSVYFRMVLPLVLRVNEQIALDRARLLALDTRLMNGGRLSGADKAWLERLAANYRMDDLDISELKRRVDEVPVSLALAQSAEESGWGTSRFARQGNALFGQWTTDDDANSLVPKDRVEGASHAVKAFPSLLHGVSSYMRNLNTHRAYRAFRNERAAMRNSGAKLDGYSLAGTMTSYSERGEEYVDTIRLIMNANNLPELDHAWLGHVTGELALNN